MPLYALSTGHKVGLAVVGAMFVLFALSSSFLFPRFRPQYPGRGLPAPGALDRHRSSDHG